MAYGRVALIGLGLIASSISHAMRRAGMSAEITGHARTPETRAEAARLGLAQVFDSASEAVRGADLVVLAVPVGAMGEVAAEIGPHLEPGATVTDVGSVKRAVIAAVAPHLPETVSFIPGHPLAGTEHSGPGAGFAALFDNRWLLLTPLPGTDPRAIEDLAAFWSALGARVDTMDPDHHDLVLAVTSHVPHLIAYTMVGVADHLRRVTAQEVINYSAAGFRDFTRIAASDPVMWRDVFLANKEATLDILGRFTEELFAASAGDPARGRAASARLFHPHPRHPPRHHRGRAGHRRPRLRPHRRRQGRLDATLRRPAISAGRARAPPTSRSPRQGDRRCRADADCPLPAGCAGPRRTRVA